MTDIEIKYVTKNSTKLDNSSRKRLLCKFLCPVIGDNKSHIDPFMCKLSYVSYKYKSLKIGIVGIEPYLVPIKSGLDGTDIRLLQMLSERLYFTPEIVTPSSFLAVEELVGTLI